MSRSPTQRWASGLFTGKISGREHQIRGFLGHIRRGDTLPVGELHKGAGPGGITRGKDVSWEFRGNEWTCVWVCWLKSSAAFKSQKEKKSLDIVSVKPLQPRSQRDALNQNVTPPPWCINCILFWITLFFLFTPLIRTQLWGLWLGVLSGRYLSSPNRLLRAAMHKHNRMYSKWIPGASSQCCVHPFKQCSEDWKNKFSVWSLSPACQLWFYFANFFFVKKRIEINGWIWLYLPIFFFVLKSYEKLNCFDHFSLNCPLVWCGLVINTLGDFCWSRVYIFWMQFIPGDSHKHALAAICHKPQRPRRNLSSEFNCLCLVSEVALQKVWPGKIDMQVLHICPKWSWCKGWREALGNGEGY